MNISRTHYLILRMWISWMPTRVQARARKGYRIGNQRLLPSSTGRSFNGTNNLQNVISNSTIYLCSVFLVFVWSCFFYWCEIREWYLILDSIVLVKNLYFFHLLYKIFRMRSINFGGLLWSALDTLHKYFLLNLVLDKCMINNYFPFYLNHYCCYTVTQLALNKLIYFAKYP